MIEKELRATRQFDPTVIRESFESSFLVG